jgi:hypothetical protein
MLYVTCMCVSGVLLCSTRAEEIDVVTSSVRASACDDDGFAAAAHGSLYFQPTVFTATVDDVSLAPPPRIP